MSIAQSSEMVTRTLTVPCVHGVHLRAAARIVMLTKQFQSQIWLTAGNRSARASSILGVLELGATQGTPILIGAQGPDAPQAVEALAKLFASRECGATTDEISEREVSTTPVETMVKNEQAVQMLDAMTPPGYSK